MEHVIITQEEYEDLLSDAKFLSCLTSCGVDNWEGYDYAVEMFNEDSEE